MSKVKKVTKAPKSTSRPTFTIPITASTPDPNELPSTSIITGVDNNNFTLVNPNPVPISIPSSVPVAIDSSGDLLTKCQVAIKDSMECTTFLGAIHKYDKVKLTAQLQSDPGMRKDVLRMKQKLGSEPEKTLQHPKKAKLDLNQENLAWNSVYRRWRKSVDKIVFRQGKKYQEVNIGPDIFEINKIATVMAANDLSQIAKLKEDIISVMNAVEIEAKSANAIAVRKRLDFVFCALHIRDIFGVGKTDTEWGAIYDGLAMGQGWSINSWASMRKYSRLYALANEYPLIRLIDDNITALKDHVEELDNLITNDPEENRFWRRDITKPEFMTNFACGVNWNKCVNDPMPPQTHQPLGIREDIEELSRKVENVGANAVLQNMQNMSMSKLDKITVPEPDNMDQGK